MVWSQSRWSYPKRSQHYACACVVTFDVNEGISSPSTSIIHGQKRFLCWKLTVFCFDVILFIDQTQHQVYRSSLWNMEWMGILFLFNFYFLERIRKINHTRQWFLYEKPSTKSTRDFTNIIITRFRICNTQIHY